jgi:quinolinate synthase
MESLPEIYRTMSREQLRERILDHKSRYGKRLVILGHHYQKQEVIDFSDFRGDSLGLSRLAAGQTDCEFIVFCGVHFMAESAEVVRQAHQTVQHPDFDAGCPMAEMADVEAVRRAWELVCGTVRETSVIPVTYMNSSAELKAFCGRKHGVVCTSSNAAKVFAWALQEGEKIFFFPDEHLGRNTARVVGIPEEEITLWDPYGGPRGEPEKKAIDEARLLLWKGFCHVHTHFRTDHIRKAREESPGARVVVHPECPQDVVLASDTAGSTEYILRYVREAPKGSTIYVGTETNFVSRLAREHPEKTVRELARSVCPNMSRIDMRNLLWTLDEIGRVNRVYVDTDTKEGARLALDRMLQLA